MTARPPSESSASGEDRPSGLSDNEPAEAETEREEDVNVEAEGVGHDTTRTEDGTRGTADAAAAGVPTAVGATKSGHAAVVPYMPIKPIYGGLTLVGPDLWAAWTGGKPRADWAELKNPDPAPIVATQYRATSVTSKAKSRSYRVKGMKPRFTQTSDLHTLQKKVKEHLVAFGLDTIAYVTSPSDKNKVVSVIEEHGLFTLKEGCKAGNESKARHFDSYSLENDQDAKEFLMKSVDEDLETELYNDTDDDDSFVALWFSLIHVVRSVSISRYDKVKDRVKCRTLNEYAGENIELISKDFTDDYKELQGARMYDHNLTMNMLETIMKAGGTANKDFRHPLRRIKDKLETKLLEVRHMGYTKAQQTMARDKLDVKSVLKACKEEYRKCYNNDKWPAAAHVQDSKAMNRNFGQATANALMQLTNSQSKDTPNKGRRSGAKQYNSGNKSSRNNPNRDRLRRNGSSGRGLTPLTTPPKPGKSKTKDFGDQKRWWCKTCKRWTILHSTDGHKTKEQLKAKAQAKAKMARVSFDSHPSAFKAVYTGKSQMEAIVDQVVVIILCVIGLMGLLWLLTNGVAYVTAAIAEYDFAPLQNLMAQGLALASKYWTVLVTHALSSVVGFGTATKCYKSIDDTKYRGRVRRGPAATYATPLVRSQRSPISPITQRMMTTTWSTIASIQDFPVYTALKADGWELKLTQAILALACASAFSCSLVL